MAHSMIPMSDRLVRVLAGVLANILALLLLVVAARADAPFSFDATPGKLPKTVVPIHYSVDLQPNLSALTVRGTVKVDIEVREPTDRLVLNALGLTFTGTTLDDITSATSTAVDENQQTVTFTFPHSIAVGHHQLRIGYTAPINQDGHGIYWLDYQVDGSSRRMIA